MLEAYRVGHYVRVTAAALVAFWVLVHFFGGNSLVRSGFGFGGALAHGRYAELFRSFRDERAVFEEDFLEHEVSGPFVGDGLAALCGRKTWTPGLVLTCDAVPGSVADVKNGILTCVRVAVEMGAEVILPDVMLRSTIDLKVVAPHDVGPRRGVPLERFFDRGLLLRRLADACPQLTVHASLDAFFDQPAMQAPLVLDLYKVPGVEVAPNLPGSGGRVVLEAHDAAGATVDGAGAGIGARIHALLDAKVPPRGRAYPMRVALRPTPSFALPAFADEPALRSAFGRLLAVRRDLRRLAAAVLFNLQKALGVRLDPRKGIDIDAFVGVELRTQPDPQAFPGYDVQASDALSFVVASNMTRVYLAEGATRANASAFAERCADFRIAAVTKDDLVDGDDAAVLAGLSYDERFLVDYEVLLRAGLFTGHAQSSVAWSVALRRELAFGDAGLVDAAHLNGTVRWHDQYSTLYGKEHVGDDLRRTIWP